MRNLLLVTTAVLIATACQQRDAETRDAGDEVASRQAARVDPTQAEQAIQTLNQRWLRAMTDKDAATIAGLFADDGVAIYSGEKLEGPAAVRRDAEESFRNRPNATGTFTSEQIVISDDGTLAYDIGTYRGLLEPDAPAMEGRYLTLWKNIDGEWKVVADIASDKPASTAASE